MGNHGRQVESAEQHLLHLIPCLPHPSARYAFDSQRIEYHVRPIHLRIVGQDTQLRNVRAFVHVRNHIVECRRRTRHLQSHVEALDTQLLHRALHGLAFRAVHRQRRTHLLRYLQPQRVQVGYHDMLRAGVAADARCHRTNQPRARNQHIFTQQRECQCRVCRVAERVHYRREVIGNLGANMHDIALGNSYILCKRAVFAEDTHRQAVLAHMPHPAAAVTAVPTHDMPLGGYAVAHLRVAHTRTYLHNLAHELMPHCVGRRAVALRPLVPLVHVQVCTAYRGFLHLD